MSDDFFDEAVNDVRRDRRGRPQLIPRGGGASGPRATYDRASSMADYISDDSHLTSWNEVLVAKGVGMRPDLALRAAAAPYTMDLPRLKPGTPEARARTAARKEIEEVISQAKEAAGASIRSGYGTAFHSFTEPDNPCEVPDVGEMVIDVSSYEEGLKTYGVVPIATEVFTANDELMTAGTFDHLYWTAACGIVIGDKKTGAPERNHWAIQLSTYSHGDVYDIATDERTDLATFAAQAGREANVPTLDFDPDIGLVVRTQGGKTEFHFVDLEEGYRAAQIAAQARDYRQLDPGSRAEATLRRRLVAAQDDLAKRLTSVASKEEARDIWTTHQHIWTDEHTRLVSEKREEA